MSVGLNDFIFYADKAYEDVISVYPKTFVNKVVLESEPEATKPVVKKAAKKSR